MVNLLDNAFLYRAALNTVKFRKVSLTPPSYMSNTTLEMATVSQRVLSWCQRCPERRMETFVVRDGSLESEQG